MARKTISTANITMSLIDRAVVYFMTIFQLTRILTNDERHGASVENNETFFFMIDGRGNESRTPTPREQGVTVSE